MHTKLRVLQATPAIPQFPANLAYEKAAQRTHQTWSPFAKNAGKLLYFSWESMSFI